MDLSVNEFIEGLFSKEATEQPSNTDNPEDIKFQLPEWFDEKEYNKGRRFFWDNCFQLLTSMLLGLVAVFSIPSIIKLLIGTRRSNSSFTAYKRYLSTLLHTVTWFEYDLKPGTTSWQSLVYVRTRHIRASRSSTLKGQGIISQRDLALTQFGFIGFSFIKADKFGIRQLEDGDWEAYNHFWKTIGYCIGLEDKYNICRKNVDETRQVLQIILDQVFTPCLENVPEYFEHMARKMLDGIWCVNPTVNVDAMLYWTRHLSNVPGYIYTETERNYLQQRIKEKLSDKSMDVGVEASSLMSKCLIDIPASQPRLLYLSDYETLEGSPAYKKLPLIGKYKLALNAIITGFYRSYFGRIYMNLNFRFSLLLMRYLPYLAFFRFGVLASYVNIFRDGPADYEEPKPNSEYYKEKPPVPLYKEYLSLIW